MELSHDWRSFQAVFYPGKRSPVAAADEARTPVYLVTQGDLIISAFSEFEDLSLWIGAKYQDMALEMPQREFVLFEREKVDQVLQSSLALPHFYEQVEYLREQASAQRVAEASAKKAAQPKKLRKLRVPKPFVLKPGTKEVAPRHFLLEAMQTWWAKVLPSSYGVFVRLEEQRDASTNGSPGMRATQPRDMFLVVRRGRLDGFHVPDLTSMGKERRDQMAAVVRYLSEKHLVPVQGISVQAADWNEWAKSPNPWKKVALAIRSDRAKLVPFRWGLTTMMASRAFFGI